MSMGKSSLPSFPLLSLRLLGACQPPRRRPVAEHSPQLRVTLKHVSYTHSQSRHCRRAVVFELVGFLDDNGMFLLNVSKEHISNKNFQVCEGAFPLSAQPISRAWTHSLLNSLYSMTSRVTWRAEFISTLFLYHKFGLLEMFNIPVCIGEKKETNITEGFLQVSCIQ